MQLIRGALACLRNVFLLGILLAFFCQKSVVGQEITAAQNAKTLAYQKFHNGQVREAGQSIKELASQTTDISEKLALLRDLVEICATAYEWKCAVEAETEAFEYAKSDPKYRSYIPELYSYLIKAFVWEANDQGIEYFIKNGGVGRLITIDPVTAAEENLSLHTYFVRKGNLQASENSYNAAFLCLLLIDPENRYAISKLLVKMVEALIVSQDIVGASALVDEVDKYLFKYLNHTGPHWAEYRSLTAQLSALVGNKSAVSLLDEASKLNIRLDINDDIKSYRISTGSSLGVLAEILENHLDEASKAQERHPFQDRRHTIIDRKKFDSAQEFYFALSEVLVAAAKREKVDPSWKEMFQQNLRWESGNEDYGSKLFKSYRIFGLGLIALSENDPAASELLLSAAKQRMDLFESVLKKKFEGFQLPSTIDRLIITIGATHAAKNQTQENYDLLLKGGEIIFRDTRHQLSDFAVLLGSQTDERSRKDARSYNLLARQKREWELRQLRDLLSGSADKNNRGALISTYTDLTQTTSKLKAQFSTDDRYAAAMGYPSVVSLQKILGPKDAFISYFPHIAGLGRLCVTRDKVIHSVSAFDFNDFTRDSKLLEWSVSADNPVNEKLDSQYPVAAAINLNRILFDGLERCMAPGSHLIVALPRDVSGIPLGALLASEPPRYGDGYDLKNAKWLAKEFSFSVTVSARHFIGTQRNSVGSDNRRPYLGVGDPVVGAAAKSQQQSKAKQKPELSVVDFSGFEPIPESANEIRAVARSVGASSSDILLGGGATEEAFRAKPLGAYDIIHFATHGLFKGELPGLSEAALLLTPKDATDSFDDGILSASEISRLSLAAKLVVLSACNTARISTNAAGQAINDLQSAFSIAGAPTLLASLWSVDSGTAAELMTRFFDIWSRSSDKNASEVLATAIRDYLRRADRAHQHPRFWAPFIIFGYGNAIQKTEKSILKDSVQDLQILPNSTDGEIVSAASLDKDAFLSLIGGYNGKKYAGIVAKYSAKGAVAWKISSYDIGAGKIVVANDSIISVGYISEASTMPVARRISKNGTVEWEKRFAALKDFRFQDVAVFDRSIFIVADSVVKINGASDIVLIQLDWDGAEIKRINLPNLTQSIVIGKAALLGKVGNDLVVAINGQEAPRLDTKRGGVFGLATWCKGGLTARVFKLNRESLSTVQAISLPDFQVHTIGTDSERILLGGEVRSDCELNGSAALVSIQESDAVVSIWRDNDPFASLIAEVANSKSGSVLFIRRQRPVGVRGMNVRSSEGANKRWGDNGESLNEFSVVEIDHRGRVINQTDSTFGVSAFVQGAINLNGRTTVYGSLAGQPAISMSAH